MIKGIIFDMDGVVLDSMEIWQNLGERFLKSQGRIPKPGLADILYDMSVIEGAQYMQKEYALDCTPEEIVDGLNSIIRDFYYYEVPVKPGMKKLIEDFHFMGIPMAVATSSNREHIEKALERNGILQYFRAIMTTQDSAQSKRTPKIYNMACAAINSEPYETLVFEDAVFCLETAKQAGYITIGVNDSAGGADQLKVKELSDYYIENTASADACNILEHTGGKNAGIKE